MTLNWKLFLPPLLAVGVLSIIILFRSERISLPALLLIMTATFFGLSLVTYFYSLKKVGVDFHNAVKSCDIEKIKTMLRESPLININSLNKEGQAPLHVAVHEGHRELLQFLLLRGADVNVRDRTGKTPLYAGTYWDDITMVDLLIAKGADVNVRDENDSTPLHNSVKEGYREVARYLILKGAKVNSKDKQGNTPLSIALKQDNREIAALLRGAGAVE